VIILDTNVVSELMKPNPDVAVRDWLAGLGDTSLATTAITVAEITFGLQRLADGRRRAALEEQFDAWVGHGSAFPVMAFDDLAARAAGRLRAMRQGAGLAAPAADMMIAGITSVMGAILATRNVKDFDGLPIQIVDPWTAN
jgi:predicted nucleic acid-binding protein